MGTKHTEKNTDKFRVEGEQLLHNRNGVWARFELNRLNLIMLANKLNKLENNQSINKESSKNKSKDELKPKLSDIKSLLKGFEQLTDGVMLLGGGVAKIILFSILTAVDGIKVIFKGNKKTKNGGKKLQ